MPHLGRWRDQLEGLVQVLGQKERYPKDILLGGLMTEAARYPRGNRAACSLGPQSRSPTSAPILQLCQSRALIRGGSAVAE
jgi:hypothetical protein